MLHGVILRVRPGKVAKNYQSIWTEEGSPLMAISLQQAQALTEHLEENHPGKIAVALGMRYGQPSIAQALRRLRDAGADKILVLPLYPQYSASTAASAMDAVSAELHGWRNVPELRFVSNYHDDEGYISAICNSVREYESHHGKHDRLLFSFHGLPQKMVDLGDPYQRQCEHSAHLIAKQLDLADDDWLLAFQSRFGKAAWLHPYVDKTLKQWGKAGVQHVRVVCPGFSADCLETLEEIAQQNRDVFLQAGGTQYEYIPALNDRKEHIEALANIIHRNIGDWLTQ
jgi:ferrochelatase